MSQSMGLQVNPENGQQDVYFDDNGQFVSVTGKAYVAQRVTTRLRLILGEWFLNTGLGVDWFGSILTKPFNPVTVEGILKATILNTPDVTELITFDTTFTAKTRVYTLNFSIDTIYGETTMEVSSNG